MFLDLSTQLKRLVPFFTITRTTNIIIASVCSCVPLFCLFFFCRFNILRLHICMRQSYYTIQTNSLTDRVKERLVYGLIDIKLKSGDLCQNCLFISYLTRNKRFKTALAGYSNDNFWYKNRNCNFSSYLTRSTYFWWFIASLCCNRNFQEALDRAPVQQGKFVQSDNSN